MVRLILENAHLTDWHLQTGGFVARWIGQPGTKAYKLVYHYLPSKTWHIHRRGLREDPNLFLYAQFIQPLDAGRRTPILNPMIA